MQLIYRLGQTEQRVNSVDNFNRKVLKDENAKNAKPLQFDGYYSLRRLRKPLRTLRLKITLS